MQKTTSTPHLFCKRNAMDNDSSCSGKITINYPKLGEFLGLDKFFVYLLSGCIFVKLAICESGAVLDSQHNIADCIARSSL